MGCSEWGCVSTLHTSQALTSAFSHPQHSSCNSCVLSLPCTKQHLLASKPSASTLQTETLSPTGNGYLSRLHSCETLRKGCETLCSHHCAVVKPVRNVCETLRNVCETLRNVRETYVNPLCRCERYWLLLGINCHAARVSVVLRAACIS